MMGQVKMNQQKKLAACPGGAGFLAVLLVAALLGSLPGRAGATESLPAASEVTRRMIAHAQAVAQAEQEPQYTYEKRSRFERLNAAWKPVSSEEKIYHVTVICGLPLNRLVKVQGQELSAEELKREDAREEKFRQRLVSTDRKKLVAEKEALVTPELLGRYDFTVKERVALSNRTTLVLTFKPKSGDLPAESFQEKLLSQMAGTLWVDEADADIARVEVGMQEPVSLGWLGWLGSLSRCDLTLQRERMPDGVWVNRKMDLLIQCRKVVATQRFHIKEDSWGFKRVGAASSDNPRTGADN